MFLECFRNAVQSLRIQSNSYIHQSTSLSKGSHSISFYFIVSHSGGSPNSLIILLDDVKIDITNNVYAEPGLISHKRL